MVALTSSHGLSGWTLACARCHDHAAEPLMSDYYAAGIFASSQYREYLSRQRVRPTLARETKDLELVIKRLTDTQSNQLSEMPAWHTSLFDGLGTIKGSSTSSQEARSTILDQQT